MLKFQDKNHAIVLLLFCKFLKLLHDARPDLGIQGNFSLLAKRNWPIKSLHFLQTVKISQKCWILLFQPCFAKSEKLTELLSIFSFYFYKTGNSVSLFVITITAIFVNCLILSSFYFPVESNCFNDEQSILIFLIVS